MSRPLTSTAVALLLAGTALVSPALLAGTAHGQTVPKTGTFEAADVQARKLTANTPPVMTGNVLVNGRYTLRNATMVDLVKTAYSIDAENVVDGPSWLERDRFDVVAKVPNATSADDAKVMLQALLADRFKLVVHKDTRPVAAYTLTIGAGKHRLKAAEGSGTGCRNQRQGPQETGGAALFTTSCRGVTLDAFAQALKADAAMDLAGPVLNQTALPGTWDIDLRWTPRILQGLGGSQGVMLAEAVSEQLGLKLELHNVLTPVLVVDRVNQSPSANPPQTSQLLPPPATEFEVATVKLSPATDVIPRVRIIPSGRIEMQNVTLKLMIQLGWNINNEELIAGMPKWFDQTRYSVLAQAKDATAGSVDQPQADIESLQAMFRALLKDRLKLDTHFEDRPVMAYSLVADKPKLTKADPRARTRWKEGSAADAKDPKAATAAMSRLITVGNMTMAQLAEDLQRIAPGYVQQLPVEDATGLEGGWDFTLSFTPLALLQQAAAGQAQGTASDPTGAVSLPDALKQQLGLKLEKRRRMVPVLVIDRVEELPVDN